MCVGARASRKFNQAQTLVLQVQFPGDAASLASTVRLANVHLPSSDVHKLSDLDKTNALEVLTGFVADSHEAFGIVCGDINEKNQTRMGDRLRKAEHGAGHWRHWELEKEGEGDHIVYSKTLERQYSFVDEECKTLFCKPHYMQGGFFLPATAAMQDAIERTLRTVAGAAADLALLSGKQVSK